MPELSRDDDVFLLDLGDGANAIDPQWIDDAIAALDEVSAAAGPRALVTAARGKMWCTGLDLQWLERHPDRFDDFAGAVQELFARLLEFPVPTVAAIQGHAFGAGAMLALCHDARVMRADRGWFCLPEITIGMPLTVGMSALVRSRLAPQVAHEALVTGRRYGGQEAMAATIVDGTATEDGVLVGAVQRAAALAGTASPALGTIKRVLYAPVVDLLRSPEGRATG